MALRHPELRSGVPYPENGDEDAASRYSGGLRSWRAPTPAAEEEAPPGTISEQAGFALRRNSDVFQRLKAFATVLQPSDELKRHQRQQERRKEAEKRAEEKEQRKLRKSFRARQRKAEAARKTQQGSAAGKPGSPSAARGRTVRSSHGARPPRGSRAPPSPSMRQRRVASASSSRDGSTRTSTAQSPTSRRTRRGPTQVGGGRAATAGPRSGKRPPSHFPKWLRQRSDFDGLKNAQVHSGPVFVRQALTTPGYKRGKHELNTLVTWLTQHDVFKHLERDQMLIIAKSLTLARILPGQTLYPEKRVLYFVLTGKAYVQRPGKARVTVEAGQSLGARFWWSVVSDNIRGRSSMLGRRMSQILLHAEAAENPTRVSSEDATVESDELWERSHRRAKESSPTARRKSNMMGVGKDDKAPRATTDYRVQGKLITHRRTSRFGALDLWVPGQGQHRSGAPESPSAGTEVSESSGPPMAGESAASHSEARRAAEARKASFLATTFGATPVPLSDGGDPGGVELVKLSMGDYVDALAENRKQLQVEVVRFLQTVGYFSDWTPSRLLVLAGLLEKRNFKEGQCVFQQGEPVNGLCILMSGTCKLKKRVEVTKTQRWPVEKRKWGKKTSHAEWQVEIKVLKPKAVFGEEAALISKKYRKALVSSYFSNAFVAQTEAQLPTRGGTSGHTSPAAAAHAEDVAKATKAMRAIGGLADTLVKQQSVRSLDLAATESKQSPKSSSRRPAGPMPSFSLSGHGAVGVATAADPPVEETAKEKAIRRRRMSTATATADLAKDAIKAIMSKERPYSVVAVEPSSVLFLRPEHFTCLYHTALMPKLRKLARVQATEEVVIAAEAKRRAEQSEHQHLRDLLVGERYQKKIARNYGDPAPPPPDGPLIPVPRTDEAMNIKAPPEMASTETLMEYMESFKFQSPYNKRWEQRQAEEARKKAHDARKRPHTSPVLGDRARQRAAGDGPASIPRPRVNITDEERRVMPKEDGQHAPSSSASRRMRLGSAKPPTVRALTPKWGETGMGGWEDYMTVGNGRVVIKRLESRGSRRARSPKRRPATSPAASTTVVGGEAGHARRLQEASHKAVIANRKQTAQSRGRMQATLSDTMTLTGKPSPVGRPANRTVDPARMEGAAAHRLWEHHHMDTTTGLSYRMSLPYPTNVFHRAAREAAVEEAKAKAEAASSAAEAGVDELAESLSQQKERLERYRRPQTPAAEGALTPVRDTLVRDDHPVGPPGVAGRVVDEAVYDDIKWWTSQKVAADVTAGRLRGDSMESVEQLRRRLNVSLRWRPTLKFEGGKPKHSTAAQESTNVAGAGETVSAEL